MFWLWSLLFFVQFYCSWLCFALRSYGGSVSLAANVSVNGINASVTHVLLDFPTSTYNGTAVPTSTAHSSSSRYATTSIPTPSLPANSTITSSTSGASYPAVPAPTNATDPDLLTIALRRIEFIIAQQSGAKSLSVWFVHSS